MKAFDLTGKPLEVGDEVAYCQAGYVRLYIGYVTKITAKGLKVSTDKNSTGTFRYCNEVVKL